MAQGMPLQTGDPEEIAGYRVTRRLGVGGQGTVFLGHDPDGTAVAIKMLHARFDGDAKARARFAREIEAARRVASFCTARVLAADLSGDTPYLVGEFIDGPALSNVVRGNGPLTGDELHGLAVGTATALVAIHEAGVVHRDLKPSNILLGPLGPRVVDFGIAKAMDVTSTTTSQLMGTPAYMSPEQVGGDPVGPPSDVFAWGATLVFAATGRPPFGQDTVPAVFNRVLTKEPDLAALTGPLRDIAAACMSKEPSARPTADRLLHHLLHGESPRPAPATAETVPVQPEPPTRVLPSDGIVRWVPKIPDSLPIVWTAFALTLPLGLAVLAVLTETSGPARIFAVVPAVLFLLSSLWGRQVSTRPIKAGSIEVAADDSGLTARIDGLPLYWHWNEIAQVTVRPLGNSWLWGSLARFSGIYAVPAPARHPWTACRAGSATRSWA